MFLANAYEVLCLTGAKTLAAALVRLRRDFAAHAVIKRGARGILALRPAS